MSSPNIYYRAQNIPWGVTFAVPPPRYIIEPESVLGAIKKYQVEDKEKTKERGKQRS